MAAQTWDSALARASAAAGQVPQVAANIAVLTQLRERWQDSVDMIASMFDLMIVPSGAGWPGGWEEEVFVRMMHDERSGEPVVRVELYRSRARSSLTEPGGTVLVAGDICALPTAPSVVEAFLYQMAYPAVTGWDMHEDPATQVPEVQRLPAGARVFGTVVCHHPWGVGIRLADGTQYGHVDVPFIRDGPARGPLDYPPIGQATTAVVLLQRVRAAAAIYETVRCRIQLEEWEPGHWTPGPMMRHPPDTGLERVRCRRRGAVLVMAEPRYAGHVGTAVSSSGAPGGRSPDQCHDGSAELDH